MGDISSFKKFTDHQKAVEWGLSCLHCGDNGVFRSETEESRFYVELGALTGNNYKILNSVLWGNKDYNDIEAIMEEIEIINAGISSFIIPEDIIVYRATKLIFIKTFFGSHCPRRGTIHKYPAFLHTSLTFKRAWEFAMERFPEYNCFMKIYIPKGSPGMFIDSARTGRLNEQEIILPKDCMLKVKKAIPGYYECLVLQ